MYGFFQRRRFLQNEIVVCWIYRIHVLLSNMKKAASSLSEVRSTYPSDVDEGAICEWSLVDSEVRWPYLIPYLISPKWAGPTVWLATTYFQGYPSHQKKRTTEVTSPKWAGPTVWLATTDLQVVTSRPPSPPPPTRRRPTRDGLYCCLVGGLGDNDHYSLMHIKAIKRSAGVMMNTSQTIRLPFDEKTKPITLNKITDFIIFLLENKKVIKMKKKG